MFPRRSLVFALACLTACTGDGDADSSSVSGITTSSGTDSTSETSGTATDSGSDTETSTSGPTSTTSSSTTGTDDECKATSECSEGNVCAASYGQAKGPNMCVPECVENLDESRWCVDDAACCNAGAECTAVGLCTGGDSGGTSTSTSTGG